ncbi:MAG: EI24 domain-containing protein [Saprospiraceae bacterium]|nr:EI24 domain-containing protein [Saprospiraceae bacterium]
MLTNFFDGITSYGAAFRHISKHGLWAYVLLPGLLTILIAVAVFGAAWGLSDNIGDQLDNLWKWETGRKLVEKIAQVFGGLLVLAFSFIIFKQLVLVIASPFMSFLSEKVESQLLGKESTSGFTLTQAISDIVRGLRIAVRNLLREMTATIFLLLLGLFPLFTPFTTFLVFVLQAYYAGFGNLDFALERKCRYRESLAFVQNNRMLAIGNGTVYLLLLFTFIGFLVALPVGVVAATLETNKRLSNRQ